MFSERILDAEEMILSSVSKVLALYFRPVANLDRLKSVADFWKMQLKLPLPMSQSPGFTSIMAKIKKQLAVRLDDTQQR